ncbi:MAG: hypothetical protein J6X43_05300 [Bacteroidales bacterium]|nr:hypothetical protein [Bacteroidales bacterium]
MKKFVLQIILIIMGLSFLNFLTQSTCKVYKGTSTYSSDVICNSKDGKIYKGNSSYSSDVLVTIRDKMIYKGNSSYSSDIICNWKDGKVYKGTSSYSSDVLYTISDHVNIAEFIAIWHVVNYVY